MSDFGERKARDTLPRTLSGIPRVEGVAPESPAQHIRNALTILSAEEQMQRDKPTLLGGYVVLTQSDFDAIASRMERAICMLEGCADPRPIL